MGDRRVWTFFYGFFAPAEQHRFPRWYVERLRSWLAGGPQDGGPGGADAQTR